jgi:hypothetical protein
MAVAVPVPVAVPAPSARNGGNRGGNLDARAGVVVRLGLLGGLLDRHRRRRGRRRRQRRSRRGWIRRRLDLLTTAVGIGRRSPRRQVEFAELFRRATVFRSAVWRRRRRMDGLYGAPAGPRFSVATGAQGARIGGGAHGARSGGSARGRLSRYPRCAVHARSHPCRSGPDLRWRRGARGDHLRLRRLGPAIAVCVGEHEGGHPRGRRERHGGQHPHRRAPAEAGLPPTLAHGVACGPERVAHAPSPMDPAPVAGVQPTARRLGERPRRVADPSA